MNDLRKLYASWRKQVAKIITNKTNHRLSFNADDIQKSINNLNIRAINQLRFSNNNPYHNIS